MKRLPYSSTIVSAAIAIARKTIQQRGVRLVSKHNRQYIVRSVQGEGLAIVANQRSWG